MAHNQSHYVPCKECKEPTAHWTEVCMPCRKKKNFKPRTVQSKEATKRGVKKKQ